MPFPSRSLLCAVALLGLSVGLPAHADEKTDALLRDVERAVKAIPSLSADLVVTLTTQNLSAQPSQGTKQRQTDPNFSGGNDPIKFTYSGTVKLKRPNLARLDFPDPIRQIIACDGATLWTLLPTSEYVRTPSDPQGRNMSAYAPILMFFAPETARTAGVVLGSTPVAVPANFTTRYLGKERINLKEDHGKDATSSPDGSREYDVVEVRRLKPAPQAYRLYINADKLVSRYVTELRRGTLLSIQEVTLINIKLGQAFTDSDFAFTLPPDARPYQDKPAITQKPPQ